MRGTSSCVLKKNLNASGPSEHSPVRGENVKTFRWDHRLPRQNHMTFRRVPFSPVLLTCPRHTNSGCGKERRILIGPW